MKSIEMKTIKPISINNTLLQTIETEYSTEALSLGLYINFKGNIEQTLKKEEKGILVFQKISRATGEDLLTKLMVKFNINKFSLFCATCTFQSLANVSVFI